MPNQTQPTYGTSINPITGLNTPGGVYNAPNAQNPYGSFTALMDTNVLAQPGQMPQLPSVAPLTTPGAFVSATPTPAVTQATPPPTPLNVTPGNNNAVFNRIQDAYNKLLGKGERAKALETESGIPQVSKEIATLSEQIATKKAAFDQAAMDVTGKPIGIERQTGKIAQIQRNEAVQIGGLSALLMAKQGNLQAARDEVDRTLKLEFEPIQTQINALKEFYEMNQNDLSESQSIKLQASIREQQANADFLRNVKKSAYDQIIQKGGSQEQANAIAEAKSVKDIIKTFGTSIVAAATPKLPNGKPDVVSELANTIKLSGEAVPSASKALGVLASISKIASANPEGKFVGLVPAAGTLNLRSGDSRREYIDNRADVAAIKGTVSTWLSGANLSADQEKYVNDLIPKKNDTDFAVRTKLNSLTEYMQQQAKAELAAKGINYTPTKIDYFAIPVDNYINTAVETVVDPYEQYLLQINQNQ